MLRTATALALLSATAVVAAPVPPPTEKERLAKDWGKTDGAGEFDLKGKQLTLRSTTGKPNYSFGGGEHTHEPRTARTVKGDFEITVRVLDAVPPGKDVKCDSGSAETNAGLYVQGGNSCLKYHLNQAYHQFPGAPADAELARNLGMEASFPRGGAGGTFAPVEDGKSLHLRIIRKDKVLTMAHSFDGEKWSEPNNPFAGINMDFPDELTVGVYYSHSTCQFGHATFDKFTIEKPKAAKSK